MARLPEELRKKLDGHAKRNERSMNAEIINRLEQSLDPMLPRSEMIGILSALLQPEISQNPGFDRTSHNSATSDA